MWKNTLEIEYLPICEDMQDLIGFNVLMPNACQGISCCCFDLLVLQIIIVIGSTIDGQVFGTLTFVILWCLSSFENRISCNAAEYWLGGLFMADYWQVLVELD